MKPIGSLLAILAIATIVIPTSKGESAPFTKFGKFQYHAQINDAFSHAIIDHFNGTAAIQRLPKGNIRLLIQKPDSTLYITFRPNRRYISVLKPKKITQTTPVVKTVGTWKAASNRIIATSTRNNRVIEDVFFTTFKVFAQLKSVPGHLEFYSHYKAR